MPSWPATLVQAPLRDGFSDRGPDLTIENKPDIGAPKVRRRGTAGVRDVACSVVLRSAAEKLILDDFYYRTLAAGTLTFTWASVQAETGGLGPGAVVAQFRITTPPRYRRRGAAGYFAEFPVIRITPVAPLA